MSKVKVAIKSSDLLTKVELGSVVSQIKITAMPGDLPEETQFVGLEDIASQSGKLISSSSVSSFRSRVFKFQSCDVLYGRLRPYLKKAIVADFVGAASGEIIVLRCSKQILPRYLQILLLSDDFTQYINSRVKGDRPRTSMTILAGYRLDLPSIEVQESICARFNHLEAAVFGIEIAQIKINTLAKTLVDAMRTKLIWGETDNANTLLRDLVESIDYGTTQKSTFNHIGTPVLRIPNISLTGRIDDSNLKFSPLDIKDIEKYRLKEDDLLLIRSNGSLSLVGRSAKVEKKHEGYAFAGYLLRLRPIKGVLSDYLLEIFRSRAFMQLVETSARSTSGVNNLSASRLADFKIPLKPLESQKQIVDVLLRVQKYAIFCTENLKLSLSKAKILQETMRGIWLGQSLINANEQIDFVNDLNHIKTVSHEKVEALENDMDIDNIIIQRLMALPSRSATFEVLSQGLKYDYDEIRDVIFKLLSMTPPRLTQLFDNETHSVVLRCPE